MRFSVKSSTRLILVVLAPLVVAGCGPGKMMQEMMEMMSGQVMPAPEPGQASVDLPGEPLSPPPDPESERPIPFSESLPPDDPPPPAAPPPRPLSPWDHEALDVLYERPSPMGPTPIARDPAAAIMIEGRDPVIQVLPGPTVFADSVPREMRVAMPPETPFSNTVVQLPRGQIRIVAFDRTVNDSKLSQDSLALDAAFTDSDGNDWRVVVMRIAPLSPDPVTDPWAGGVVIDSLWHGQTMRGSPAFPLINHMLGAWGWADVWKNGNKVGSSVLLHLMLTNDTRDDQQGFRWTCYDCTGRPVRQIHLMLPPQNNLPAPGGFLHVMWENSEWRRGTPDQIAARAPALGPNLPPLMLLAIPYLRWSDTNIAMQVGQTVRLSIINMDPSSFHALMVRGPDGLMHIPLPQGSRWDTSLAFDQPGEYEFWCPVSNHRMRGMYGRFVVTEGVPGGSRGVPGGGG